MRLRHIVLELCACNAAGEQSICSRTMIVSGAWNTGKFTNHEDEDTHEDVGKASISYDICRKKMLRKVDNKICCNSTVI